MIGGNQYNLSQVLKSLQKEISTKASNVLRQITLMSAFLITCKKILFSCDVVLGSLRLRMRSYFCPGLFLHGH